MIKMSTSEILAETILLVSVFGYVDYRWIKWPPTIGTMVLALLFSVPSLISSQEKHTHTTYPRRYIVEA